ncbi:MAG: hypothetical protein QF412_11835 [Planctomycetota bacterium]|jgi:hypothetical protein|nr:hypothetical protein [Planctomycetota bacterium]
MADEIEAFLERDFLAYERHRQKDAEYDALRLSVRRKLKSIVDEAKALARTSGAELASQAGLHRPYSYNNYRVREQRAYLCRSDQERKKLARYFGDALGKDAMTHYIQTVLELALDEQVVEVALRIHPMAWWDGEHLKKKVGEDGGLECWCEMLRDLPPGFALKLHDWKKVYWAATAKPATLREYFASYTPGEHWLHLVRELPREDALAMGLDAPTWAVTSLLSLLPAYRFILWEP